MGWLDRLRGRTDRVLEPGDEGYRTDREQVRADQRERAKQDQVRRREANLEAGGESAAEELASSVRGKHFTEWPDTVRQLKRDGRTDEALQLLLECVAATERGRRGREPAPWYTLQAAIIYRQGKDYASEVEVLERWEAACPPAQRGPGVTQGDIAERLVKARALRDRGSPSA